MAQAPSDTQKSTGSMQVDMPMEAQQGASQPPVAAQFSEETLEGASQDAKMKFVTSLIERHLSGSDLDFSHLHEVMTPMTNSSMPQKGVMIAVTPKDPNMCIEDVVASIQSTLGQVPVIQEQFNGLSSNAQDITQQIMDAAKADDTDKVKQLLGDYRTAPGQETGQRFGIDFPVGSNTAYHVRLNGITVDDLMQSLLHSTPALQELPQQQPVSDAVSNKTMDKAQAAQAVSPEQAADMPQEGKWASKMPQKDISPQGITAEQVAAAVAGKSNTR